MMLKDMAQLGSQLTGLPARFVCAWWYSENGQDFPTTNNVGNISYQGEGVPSGGIFTGVTHVLPNKVVVYDTPEHGVQAWAELLNCPVGHNGKVLTVDSSQLLAHVNDIHTMCVLVGQSNWAESHYNDGSGAGSLIWDAYNNSVISAWYSETPAPVEPVHTETTTTVREGLQTYTVREGDTLSVIASHFRLPFPVLGRFNGLADFNHIEVGQVLTIPIEYRVKAGDTVTAIAEQYHTTVDEIAHTNSINPDVILVGEQIWV